jgi:hypothetical protein
VICEHGDAERHSRTVDLNVEDIEPITARVPNNEVSTTAARDTTTDTSDPTTTGKADDEFIIDQILYVRTKRKRREYKIRWKGYSARHDSWIPKNQMNQAAKEYAQSMNLRKKSKASTNLIVDESEVESDSEVDDLNIVDEHY